MKRTYYHIVIILVTIAHMLAFNGCVVIDVPRRETVIDEQASKDEILGMTDIVEVRQGIKETQRKFAVGIIPGAGKAKEIKKSRGK